MFFASGHDGGHDAEMDTGEAETSASEGEAEMSNSDDDEVSGDVRWKTRLVDARPGPPSQPAATEEHIWRREQGRAWEHWFVVKQSQIGAFAGDGLFAARDFRHGTVIGVYSGPNVGVPKTPAGEAAAAKLFADKAGAEDSRGRYVFWLGEGEGSRYVDGGEGTLAWRSGMARMNDAGGAFVNAHVANTGTVKVGPKDNKEKRTKRHIAMGEEIFIQYGRHYWSKWGPRREPEGNARQAIIATKAEAKRAERARAAERGGAGRGRKRTAASAGPAGGSSGYSDEVELDLAHPPP